MYDLGGFPVVMILGFAHVEEFKKGCAVRIRARPVANRKPEGRKASRQPQPWTLSLEPLTARRIFAEC
jgi:hypothetical protein